MRYDYVHSVIDSLQRGWYGLPNKWRSKEVFQQASYRYTALCEIRGYLDMAERSSPFRENPIEYLERFRKMCDDVSCGNYGDDMKMMFGVFYDVATEILDVLYTRRELL